MRRVALLVRLVLAVAAVSPAALAQDPPPFPPTATTAPPAATAPPTTTASATAAPALPAAPPPPAAPAPLAAPIGIAVVALGGATDAAWPLAQAIYGTPSLRPAMLDEPRARVLCGEPAPPGLRSSFATWPSPWRR